MEVFVDKRWILADEGKNIQEYIFDRSGRLIMSANGNAAIGKWELLQDRLLIDRGTDMILLQHAFVSDALLVLKKSGTEEIPFLLYNSSIIANGNIQGYLEKYLEQKDHRRFKANDVLAIPADIKTEYETNRGTIFIHQQTSNKINQQDPAFIKNGEPAPSGEYKIKELPIKLIIAAGKVAYAMNV